MLKNSLNGQNEMEIGNIIEKNSPHIIKSGESRSTIKSEPSVHKTGAIYMCIPRHWSSLWQHEAVKESSGIGNVVSAILRWVSEKLRTREQQKLLQKKLTLRWTRWRLPSRGRTIITNGEPIVVANLLKNSWRTRGQGHADYIVIMARGKFARKLSAISLRES